MASLDNRKPAVLSEVIAIWQLSGCATSPVTGGLDFVLMSGEQLAGAPSHEIGHVTARQSVRQQSVQAIGNTLARLAGQSPPGACAEAQLRLLNGRRTVA